MALQESFKDAFGNLYRKQGDEWQVMRPGVGWTPFSGEVDIYLASGEVIPASAKQHDEPKWSEAEKSLLISHARDIHMQIMASLLTENKTDADFNCIAVNSVKISSFLVEALKREGVL